MMMRESNKRDVWASWTSSKKKKEDKDVYDIIQLFLEGHENMVVIEQLNSYERKNIHEACDILGLEHESATVNEHRILTLMKPVAFERLRWQSGGETVKEIVNRVKEVENTIYQDRKRSLVIDQKAAARILKRSFK